MLQTEHMRSEVSSLSIENIDIDSAPVRPPPPSSQDSVTSENHSADLGHLGISSVHHTSKKRRTGRRHEKNASVVSPDEDEYCIDENNVISDAPSRSFRKRKLRSHQQLSGTTHDDSKPVIVPHDNDFICLGPPLGCCTNNTGYRTIREWASEHDEEYYGSQKKSAVLQEALDALRQLDPPGRFLKKKRDGYNNEYWVEQDDDLSCKKVKYYFFRNGNGMLPNSPSPTLDSSIEEHASAVSDEVSPTQDLPPPKTSICNEPERELISETNEVSVREEMSDNMNEGPEREEVSKILFNLVTVVDSIANDEKLSTHVDEEWLVEEKQIQTLLKEAFNQANLTDDLARWESLQEHASHIKASFISEPTFKVWWNDFDSRVCSLPDESIETMVSFCKSQRMISYYTQDVAVLAPPGILGIILGTRTSSTGCAPSAAMNNTVVSRLRVSSVMANQVCPGDRIVAIDDEDVSEMEVEQILSIMAKKRNDDRVLVIRPSLASTMQFTKSQLAPQSVQSNLEIIIFTHVKAHITANRLRYNEVRVLLQLPPYMVCKTIGELCALYKNEPNFNKAWASVIPKLASWWVTVVDSKRQRSFEAPTLVQSSTQVLLSLTSELEGAVGLEKVKEICDCLKLHIATNQMQYDDVRGMLHLSSSSVLGVVGAKLYELHNELGSNKFGRAFSQAKKHILYWFVSTSKIDQTNVEEVPENSSQESTGVCNRRKHIITANDNEPTIVRVIEKAASLPHCEKTQKRCFSAIQKYIVNAETTSQISHNKLSTAVANAMKAHSERSNIQGDALVTLSQIVWSFPAASKHMVEELGCLRLAIDAMKRHVSHSKTQQSACELLVAFSYDETCCNAMIDSEVISLALMSVGNCLKCLKKSQSKVLAAGLLFLRNMAAFSLDNVAQTILREESIISALLHTVHAKSSDNDLLISLFGLLTNLALHPDGSSRIVKAGGAELVNKLVSIKSDQLLQGAFELLLTLSLNATAVKMLAEIGCGEKIIAHADRVSKDNPDLLLTSLSLLEKLIDANVAANQNKVASGAEALALASISNHPSNKQLRSVAISVLQKVSE